MLYLIEQKNSCMKKYLLLLSFSFLFSEFVAAQYSSNGDTYYFTPPTSGCNGLWAVDYQPLECGSAVYYYDQCSIGGPNCWQYFNQIGDTAFFQLCCIPCTLTIMGDSGACCSAAVFISTDIMEYNLKNSFSINPNPAHDNFTISFNEQVTMDNAQLIIYDLAGREVQQEKIRSQLSTFNFQLSSGIYFVQVSDGEKVAVQKLVVE
jgi:hypothetical protein